MTLNHRVRQICPRNIRVKSFQLQESAIWTHSTDGWKNLCIEYDTQWTDIMMIPFNMLCFKKMKSKKSLVLPVFRKCGHSWTILQLQLCSNEVNSCVCSLGNWRDQNKSVWNAHYIYIISQFTIAFGITEQFTIVKNVKKQHSYWPSSSFCMLALIIWSKFLVITLGTLVTITFNSLSFISFTPSFPTTPFPPSSSRNSLPLTLIIWSKFLVMTQSQLVWSFESQGVSKILRACRNFGKVNG